MKVTHVYRWGLRGFRSASLLLVPSVFVYGLARAPKGTDARPWEIGFQWLFWGFSFGKHWKETTVEGENWG